MSETSIIRQLRSNGSVLFLVTTFALYHKQKQRGYPRLCQSRLIMSKGHYSSLSSLFSDKQIKNRKTWHWFIISVERVFLTLSPARRGHSIIPLFFSPQQKSRGEPITGYSVFIESLSFPQLKKTHHFKSLNLLFSMILH